MEQEIFLDNNATTQPLPEVADAVLGAMSVDFGNPSSSNRTGERGRRVLQRARQNIANLIQCSPENLFFTSGATEANNWVIQKLTSTGGSLVTTTTEHSSAKALAEAAKSQGVTVTLLPVADTGRICLEDFDGALSRNPTLVSVHWVNNETGVIQPIDEIARLCSERNVPLHVDASQAVGKLQVDVGKLPCDYLSFSGHKFHGPQGIGGLYVRPGSRLAPMLLGGGQEHGRRAGTENLPGIAGLGAAARARCDNFEPSTRFLSGLRDRFESAVLNRIPDVQINGDASTRVCNTASLRFSGLDGQALVVRLDQRGVQCSQSSACTNQRPEPSYVLRAMGLSEAEAYSSIRFSVSVLNTEEEIDRAVTILVGLVTQLRAFEQKQHQSA